MNKNGPIVIIDDDVDDRDILNDIFKELSLPNEIFYFTSGQAALDYLRLPQSNPFIIISDLHLHEFNGFGLKELIDNDPVAGNKSVPLVFVTTGTTPDNLRRAYKMSVQGIFYKPPQYDTWKRLVQQIYDYWQLASS